MQIMLTEQNNELMINFRSGFHIPGHRTSWDLDAARGGCWHLSQNLSKCWFFCPIRLTPHTWSREEVMAWESFHSHVCYSIILEDVFDLPVSIHLHIGYVTNFIIVILCETVRQYKYYSEQFDVYLFIRSYILQGKTVILFQGKWFQITDQKPFKKWQNLPFLRTLRQCPLL